MQKTSKIMMITVSVLLSLVLITSSVVSGTLAKYTTTGESSDSARVAKWGITVTSGTELSKSYEKNGTVVVESSDEINLIAPGTSGCLAWFTVSGTPEVKYNVDFNGAIEIGDGYKASSHLLRNEVGRSIDYFPIIISLKKHNLDADGNVISSETEAIHHNVSRLTPDSSASMSYFSDSSWESVSKMQNVLNGNVVTESSKSLNEALDSLGAPAVPVNSLYTVEWMWPYSADSKFDSKSADTFSKTVDDTTYTYQTADLDTQLGEAMIANKDTELFKIKLNMSVVVKQIKDLYTREGDRITFGSYPQSEVTDATLKATLDGLTSELEWITYKNTTESFNVHYADVRKENDTYRGVKVDDGTEIFWFKYDPIVWIVLEETDGKAFLVSEKLLDKQPYQEEYSSTTGYITSENVPENTYASSWEYSAIRKWLNETFYKTAFDKLQSSILLETSVDNSASTTKFSSNEYASDVKTSDKVFFLSYQEVTGTSTNQYGDMLGEIFLQSNDDNTAYSLKIGEDAIRWWTRSPAQDKTVTLIKYYMTSGNRWESADGGCNLFTGVRPALWIAL